MQSTLSVVVSAVAVLAAVLLSYGIYDLGPQASHMCLHVVMMNVVAPLLAAAAVNRIHVSSFTARYLWITTAAQIALLWLMHVPAIHHALMDHSALRTMSYGLLTASALSFWLTLLRIPTPSQWHAIPALAVSGKVFCLLGVLLVFAPRPLYGEHDDLAALDDHQLAGLLMIVACPMSYLTVALLMTIRLIGGTPAAQRPRHAD